MKPAGEWLEYHARSLAAAKTGKTSSAIVWIQISKKVVPTAVGRNRIRRLIKEVLRLEWVLTTHETHVFRVVKNPTKPNYEKVCHALQKFLKLR